ncbi:unnamed protein product [Meloidogyne enterolobii]|uniref:Uncharacterized protein n=1 Tax=Meloidogyne enterolobii TaxID=390850 RepID=A0ACB0YHA2_MELEN
MYFFYLFLFSTSIHFLSFLYSHFCLIHFTHSFFIGIFLWREREKKIFLEGKNSTFSISSSIDVFKYYTILY